MSLYNIGRNKLEAGLLNSSEPAFSTDELIAVTIPAYSYRLDDPIFNDRVFKLFKSTFIKFFTGLKRIWAYFFDWQTANTSFLGKLLFLIP